MNDLVDILMATYNGEKYLANQIDSILSQSHSHIHLKIRDDGSKDSTILILTDYAKKYPGLIEILPSHQNIGVKGNFSCLMAASQADYVMFSDQDDVWLQTKVHDTLKRMKEVEKNKKIPVLIHTDLIVTDENLTVLNRSFWNYAHLSPLRQCSLNRLFVQNTITGCTIMANRALINLAMPIPPEAIMHDWWLGLVAAAFGSVDPLNRATMNYRQHANNVLGAKKRVSFFTFLNNARKRLLRGRTCPKLTDHHIEKYQQANAFYQRYEMKLQKSQKNSLLAYLKLQNQSFFKNRYFILKYRLLKNGILRNLADFVFRPLG